MRAFFVDHPHADGAVRLRVVHLPSLAARTRGSLILHPGRTEFVEKYFETLRDLARMGFDVLAFDPRGQGLSTRLTRDPLKSYVERYRHYGEDAGFLQRELADLLPRPHVLLGHSMGGLAVLQAVIEGDADPEVVVASAPMVGLWDVATPILKYGFRALDRLGLSEADLPFQRQERGIPVDFEGNKLTSDPERFALWREYFLSTPALRVAGPTIRWLAESVRAMGDAMMRAWELRERGVPTLLFAPGADPIVDPAAIRLFGERAGAEVVTVVGARHELFLERDVYREAFFAELERFLEEQGV